MEEIYIWTPVFIMFVIFPVFALLSYLKYKKDGGFVDIFNKGLITIVVGFILIGVSDYIFTNFGEPIKFIVLGVWVCIIFFLCYKQLKNER